MPQPNLLFIFTDEQRADTLAAYGNARIAMPHLNALAARSTVFQNTYVTQPVCTPSRGSLMTGLYPHTHGCIVNNTPVPAQTPCLPEMLSRKYATAYMGKWHLGDEIFAQHGFDEWVSIEDFYQEFFSPGRDKTACSSYHHFLAGHGHVSGNQPISREAAAHLPEEFGKPAFLAREASRFIRANAAHPFVLYVNFLEPHMPFTGPRDAQYDPAGITLPPNFEAIPTEHQHLKTRLLQRVFQENGFGGEALQTEADWRRLIARYWGLCSLIDTHVGTILQTLEACGLDDNTIVVCTSDHGDMMGSHRLLAKSVMFQEAVRVPLLIRMPGQSVAQQSVAPFSHIDLLPTLLDALGESVPSHLQGRSRLGVLQGKPAEPPAPGEEVVVEWNLPPSDNHADSSDLLASLGQKTPYPEYLAAIAPAEAAVDAACDSIRSLITADGWKFNYSQRGDHELYDLNADPGETGNLMQQAALRPLARSLGDRLRRWQEAAEDTVTLPAI